MHCEQPQQRKVTISDFRFLPGLPTRPFWPRLAAAPSHVPVESRNVFLRQARFFGSAPNDSAHAESRFLDSVHDDCDRSHSPRLREASKTSSLERWTPRRHRSAPTCGVQRRTSPAPPSTVSIVDRPTRTMYHPRSRQRRRTLATRWTHPLYTWNISGFRHCLGRPASLEKSTGQTAYRTLLVTKFFYVQDGVASKGRPEPYRQGSTELSTPFCEKDRRLRTNVASSFSMGSVISPQYTNSEETRFETHTFLCD